MASTIKNLSGDVVKYLCKLCNQEMITFSHLSDEEIKQGMVRVWQCGIQTNGPGCKAYVFWEMNNGTIITEWIFFNHMGAYLKYNTLTKQAQVLLDNEWSDKKYIDISPIEELTSQLAKHWLERLNNYVIYS